MLVHCGFKCEETETCTYKDGHGCEGCTQDGSCLFCNNMDCWLNKGYTDENKVCEKFECILKTEPCEYVSCDKTCTQYGLCCSCGCEECPKRQVNINKLNEKEKENGS